MRPIPLRTFMFMAALCHSTGERIMLEAYLAEMLAVVIERGLPLRWTA